jgi:hypothetical protein
VRSAACSDSLPSQLIISAVRKRIRVPAHHGSAKDKTERSPHRVAARPRGAEQPSQTVEDDFIHPGEPFAREELRTELFSRLRCYAMLLASGRDGPSTYIADPEEIADHATPAKKTRR